jgi:hypothetical protein
VEECRKALESCPHDHGTVRAICRVCLGQQAIFAWDTDQEVFVSPDCPRCSGRTGDEGLEVCPCLEDFSPEMIAKAIEILRAESADHQDADVGDGGGVEHADAEDKFTQLCHALKWLQDRDRPAVPLTGQSALDQLMKLRTWANEHKEIRIPHPTAALLLHLASRGMVEFGVVPGTGKVVVHAKGAKEEFSRFVADLNRSYRHDQRTIRELLCFAFGVVDWELDPQKLQVYGRGSDDWEIQTDAFDVRAHDGLLEGQVDEIAGVLREAFGCAASLAVHLSGLDVQGWVQ